MALNGTYKWPCIFSLSNSNFLAVPENESDIVFILNWSATQNVVNNTSTINWEVKAQLKGFEYTKRTLTSSNTWGDGATGIVVGNTGSGSTWKDFTLSIREVNGATLATNTIDNLYIETLIGETKTIATGTNILTHNDDGSLEIYFSPNIRVDDTLMPWATPISGSSENDGYRFSYSAAYAALDNIATHAIIYADEGRKVKDFTDEDASVAINYAMPSGMSAQIYLSLDGNANTESTHLETVTGEGTYNYSFSATEQRTLWGILDQGLDNKQVRFFIKSTASDGTVFREPSNSVNLRIVNYMPTLDPRVVDSNPVSILLTGDSEKLIRYVSTAKFTTGAQAKKHYSIATESCTNGGGSPVYGATGEIPNVASNYFTFSATDNAGRRVQTGHEIPEEYGYWIPYVKLTCSATPTEMTADGDVAVTISGKYFEGNFSTSRPNKMYLSYELSKNNEEPVSYTRGEITPQVDGSDYSYTFTITGLEYLSVYDLTVKVSDEILTEGTVAHTILASTPIFDWGRQDFNFNVPVTIQGGSVPTLLEQGTDYSGWNYRKWSDGLYECWQRKVIPTMLGNASSASGWYSSGAILATNLSYPITFVEMPTVNVSLTPTTNTWALVVPGSTPGTTEETGVFQLLATYSHEFANRDYIFNYQVKGKWK